jgi:putative salt-induced outer membrane protein YdiY
MTRARFALGVAGVLFLSSVAAAQTPTPPPEPPKDWTGSVSAGMSLTHGNNDMVNLNAAFDSTYDPKHGNLMRWTGLFLRGTREGELVVDRTSLGYRDERNLSPRTFAFAQVDFLRDTFKEIDSLVAPAVGFGFKVVDTEPTKFFVSAGAGGVREKNPGTDAKVYGSITLDEKVTRQLTPTTTLKHAASSLLDAGEPANGLYTFAVGLSVKINARMQLSVDLLDSFKNRPPDATTKQNDVALLTSITVKY